MLAWTVPAAAEQQRDGGVDLAALFATHGHRLLRILVRLVDDEAMAEDVLQEVFLIAHKRRPDLDPNANVMGWLYGTALNVIRHHRRTLARRAESRTEPTDLERVGNTDGPERVAVDRETARRVRDCVRALPLEQREVFVLFELEEFQGAEIAALVDVPIATVWTRLHRGRERFRRLWQERERHG